ncbi:MAG: glycoside hydrolase family 9 protein [Deltaproteobacteria bacterium]|nr:glycoside hydrolase family 9 protein [Deltaproteobacteria bacterium]
MSNSVPVPDDKDTAAEAADTVMEGDGIVDNYDYTSTDEGAFTAEGIWELEPQFCSSTPFPDNYTCSSDPGGWAKALQMALWFFNTNKSGDGIDCTDVQWRGNSHLEDEHIKLLSNDANGVDMSSSFIDQYRAILDPDNDGELNLGGGYYTAGDYGKYGLTIGYMVSTVAWAMYEFPKAFSETGLKDAVLLQLKWAADYFMKNTFIADKSLPPSNWQVIAYAHQVGTPEYNCAWMPPELRNPEICPRPAFFATAEKPAADISANSAAALAQLSLVFDSDEEYATKALNYAIALYQFAKQNPQVIQDSTNKPYVSEYAWDDLAWAALWLHQATGEKAYLDEALEWLYNLPGFNKDCITSQIIWNTETNTSGCSTWSEAGTHTWDYVRSGVFVQMAIAFQNIANENVGTDDWEKLKAIAEEFRRITRFDSLGWVEASATPQGFSKKINSDHGSGWYNSAGQLVALIYAKNFPNDERSQDLIDWARSQSLYLLGDNTVNGDPEGKSFMVGFTEESPHFANHPHHAASGDPNVAEENRHILFGALVNGPLGDDTHQEISGDYVQNSVSIVYNAAFVGALAGNYYFDGNAQCPDPDFPPQEAKVDEFYTRGQLNYTGDCRSQLNITMVNESMHPPRYNEYLTARYYINVSEFEDAGIDPSGISADILSDNWNGEEQLSTEILGPFKCEDDKNADARHTWYFVLNYEGQHFWGSQDQGSQDQDKGPRTTLIDVGQAYGEGCIWNPENDWSFEGLTPVDNIKTPHITVYGEEGKLLWGEEPPCHPIQHIVKDWSVE